MRVDGHTHGPGAAKRKAHGRAGMIPMLLRLVARRPGRVVLKSSFAHAPRFARTKTVEPVEATTMQEGASPRLTDPRRSAHADAPSESAGARRQQRPQPRSYPPTPRPPFAFRLSIPSPEPYHVIWQYRKRFFFTLLHTAEFYALKRLELPGYRATSSTRVRCHIQKSE